MECFRDKIVSSRYHSDTQAFFEGFPNKNEEKNNKESVGLKYHLILNFDTKMGGDMIWECILTQIIVI